MYRCWTEQAAAERINIEPEAQAVNNPSALIRRFFPVADWWPQVGIQLESYVCDMLNKNTNLTENR